MTMDLFDFQTLRVIWWILLGVLLIGVALTDGYDLGVGMLLPFVAKTDVECYRLPQDTFEHVLLARPEIAKELSDRLASRKVGLEEAREDLDEAAKAAHHMSERERIYDGIRDFFGL